MDCVKIEDTPIFDGDNDNEDTKDPFDNSGDESICDYDYDSDDDPFKEDKEYESKNIAEPFKIKDENRSKDAPIITDQVERKTPSAGATTWDFTKLANNKYSCNHCEYVTNKRNNFYHHVKRIHMTDTKRYQCPYCPYNTIRARCLKNHIIMRHTKDSEIDWFRCHQCSHKFKHKSGFIRHMDSHKTVEQVNMYRTRTLTCDQCSKMFKRSGHLQRHVNNVHNKLKRKLLKCHLCDYTSHFPPYLKLHVEEMHGDSENLEMLKCGKCSFTTKFQRILKIHSRKHFQIIQCEKCPYQARNMSHMKLHQINHQEVKNEKDLKYRCDKCDYKTYRDYSFRVHKLKHLKPEEIQYFYCYHCEFKAKRKDNLKTHIKNLHFKKKTEFVCYICDFKTYTKMSHIAHLGKHSREQNKKQKSEANRDGKKEKQKGQSSSNNHKRAPLKRRKVKKNNDNENKNPKINELVPHISHSTQQNKQPSKSEVNQDDKKEKQSFSNTKKNAPLTRRKTRSVKHEISKSAPLKSKFMEDWLNTNKKSDHDDLEQNKTKGTDESLS